MFIIGSRVSLAFDLIPGFPSAALPLLDNMWSSLQSALLLGIAAGASAMPHIVERDIPAAQLTEFQLFAQYARGAYCYGNVHGTGKKVSCTADGGSCAAVESAQTSITASFRA